MCEGGYQNIKFNAFNLIGVSIIIISENNKQGSIMGLLSDLGIILSPEQTEKLQPMLKKLGIRQFLYILKKYANWQKTTSSMVIKWGEQIQGHFLHLNDKNQLELCLEPLTEEYEDVSFPLVLEYGRWMFEMTPSEPYSSQCDFTDLIKNIRYKYSYLQSRSRIALTIPNIPFLGLRNRQNTTQQSLKQNHGHKQQMVQEHINGHSQNEHHLHNGNTNHNINNNSSNNKSNVIHNEHHVQAKQMQKEYQKYELVTSDNAITQSLYITDKHIADHLRFRTLTKNIRMRRGCKVEILVPIFQDKNTTREELAKTQPNPDFIYMDAMAFGMGMACLQCTFSTKNLDHARYIYDQMNVLSPLMLAITAGTPFYKGKISDWDARWDVLSASVDCRNAEQRNPKSPKYLPTSRYSFASLFIWPGEFNSPQYNDIPMNIPEEIKQYIVEQSKANDTEIDPYLLNHVANIFKRDVLIAHEKFKIMTEESYTIFEMLNGTNWNSVRLKIPIDDTIGWRVQFRTMEVQLTAQYNAAFSLFIHYFTRVLHHELILNLYMPMTLVKENFERAHTKDAVRKQKFYFRTNIFQKGKPVIQELTLHQIFFGYKREDKEFVGVFNYIKKSLLNQCKSCSIKCPKFAILLEAVSQFLFDITSGKRITLAQWMRAYIDKHPDYKHNSILPDRAMDDMLLTLNEISKGTLKDSNFYPIFPEECLE